MKSRLCCRSDLAALTDNLNEYFTLADPVCDDAGVDYAVTSSGVGMKIRV